MEFVTTITTNTTTCKIKPLFDCASVLLLAIFLCLSSFCLFFYHINIFLLCVLWFNCDCIKENVCWDTNYSQTFSPLLLSELCILFFKFFFFLYHSKATHLQEHLLHLKVLNASQIGHCIEISWSKHGYLWGMPKAPVINFIVLVNLQKCKFSAAGQGFHGLSSL